MKIRTRFSRLCGWSVPCASVVVTLAFCTSAFADPSKNVVVPAQQANQNRVVKLCYVKTIASGIPQLCTRFIGLDPTTESPVEVIGRLAER